MSFGRLGSLGRAFGRMGAAGVAVPSWVIRGGSAAADIDLDFVNNRYWGASLAAISCARASTAWAADNAGNAGRCGWHAVQYITLGSDLRTILLATTVT